MKLNIVSLEGNAIHCNKGLGKLTSVLKYGTELTLVAFLLSHSSWGRMSDTVLA